MRNKIFDFKLFYFLMYLKLIRFLFLFLPFTSCYSTKSVVTDLDHWIGKTKTTLITSWGNPTQIIKDGSKGYIIVYQSEGKSGHGPHVSNGYGTLNQHAQYGNYVPGSSNSSLYKETTFYIYPNGTIYKWKYIVNGEEIKSLKK